MVINLEIKFLRFLGTYQGQNYFNLAYRTTFGTDSYALPWASHELDM